MAKKYVVTAPIAMIPRTNGELATVMRGGPVPPDAKPDALEHLLSIELIAEGEAQAGLAFGYAGDGTRLEGVSGSSGTESSGDEPVEEDSGPPAKSATKAEWVDYAVANGADRDEAEAQTKDELIAAYGA